jgi:anti-sigma regulatory factor (Ser/Thr protein kinase)
VGPQSAATLRERLVADPQAPQSARRLMERTLGFLPDDFVDRVKLLVSELVTNAVTHGPRQTDVIELTVTADPGMVRVDVTNEGGGFHQRMRRRSFRRSGWGLFLVEQLSDRWGVLDQGRTHVWFEVGYDGRSWAWPTTAQRRLHKKTV